ncbi:MULTISPECIES: DUF502 domain-containing protein [unclassified Oceanobacter]|jgi:uncharacterized membrane protein|uniref:DUF502 domain-containing protein n=1 Tax=unclassified Oceanobacter TaxID=2620260 RepID=UPI0026E37C19|nr:MULTISPECIES: DUF502 domain-containing protein [unclassified Oceanobacter]MDO6682274.1 DUF502 domain-containing protein [Oceanobacter sp. 5_MG-2023]MDP2506293.1 DUF502 domain-containing protein [Oceanobacter sp. 3_MG-2023]MDP2546446.1 DUF502 domain-containing protein [Oceanobacter sp. 4_MG-2023]MDP2609953.1 DUF502 domain-containing protein [Oceanobacter sp. 1_MG-2023]MDP2613223.1 DUF502 domain-containing protein [Oceanobacter sp. 2_MG-2023]
MPYLARVLLKGSVVVLPLVITAWLLWSTLLWLDNIGLELLSLTGLVLSDANSDIPGFGLIVMLVSLFVVGLLIQFNPISWLHSYLEDTLLRFPVVKTLYGAVKDFAGMFDGQKKQSQPVVLVDMPGPGIAVGFITNQKVPPVVQQTRPDQPLVAVYLPMSYMVGGYTLFLPKSELTQVDWSFEDAMRFAITAGVSQSQSHPKQPVNDKTSPEL